MVLPHHLGFEFGKHMEIDGLEIEGLEMESLEDIVEIIENKIKI